MIPFPTQRFTLKPSQVKLGKEERSMEQRSQDNLLMQTNLLLQKYIHMWQACRNKFKTLEK